MLSADLHGASVSAAVIGAVAVDKPALFLQGTLLLVGVLGMLLIAERRIPAEASPTTARAAGWMRSPRRPRRCREASPRSSRPRPASMQTEVFPLTMFALGGMLLFPAADDLLTMFVALEVLSLPLYLMCGLARRRRLLSQEAALKYFLLGAFSSAFFLYGVAHAVRLCRHPEPAAGSPTRPRPAPATRRWRSSASACCRSACCSRSVRCRSIRGSPTSIRARRRRSPRSWPRPPRSPRSARCCASSTSRCPDCATTGDRCCGRSRS